MTTNILQTLDGKWEDGTRPKDLYEQVIAKAPERYVAELVAGLGQKKRKVQGGCAELVSLLSEDRPDLLYPSLELFEQNLAAKAPILRWEAACTLGNLAAVDSEQQNRLPALVPQLIALLEHDSIVLQGHAARALGKIARAQRPLAAKIVKALTAAVDHFPGNRAGVLVEALELLVGLEEVSKPLARFIKPLVTSEVASVAKKARRTMKKLEQLQTPK